MKPQIALSLEQMRELQSLGLDCSDASMAWINLGGTYNNMLVLATQTNEIMQWYDGATYLSPTYTLEDILMKTFKEKAEQCADVYVGLIQNRTDHHQLLTKLYLIAVEETLSGQWRNVEDELPQYNNDVLVVYKSRFTDTLIFAIAQYDSIEGKWYSDENDYFYSNRHNITHWMPIPKLPTFNTLTHESD